MIIRSYGKISYTGKITFLYWKALWLLSMYKLWPRYISNTEATNALVPKQQAIGINSVDEIIIVFNQFHKEILYWLQEPVEIRLHKKTQLLIS